MINKLLERRKILWEKYHLDERPRTCYVCGEEVTAENCGAIAWYFGRVLVCCDKADDLRHFEAFVDRKKINWLRLPRG